MKLLKIIKGVSDCTKSTDLIINIIKRIKKSRDTIPLRDNEAKFSTSKFFLNISILPGYLIRRIVSKNTVVLSWIQIRLDIESKTYPPRNLTESQQ